MKRNHYVKCRFVLIVVIIAAICLLAACGDKEPQKGNNTGNGPTATSNPVATVSPTPTVTPVPTATPTEEPTPIPEPTPTPIEDYRLVVPDGVTRIKITDGMTGELIVLDGAETIQQFGDCLSSVTGYAVCVGPRVGYRYAVSFYRGDETCGDFEFTMELLAFQNYNETYQWAISFDEPHPVYAYIEELFARGRAGEL